MKLFYASIFRVDEDSGGERVAKLLVSAHDLSSFGFFQQNSVREFMNFTGKMLAEKTENGRHLSVQEQDYVCHVSSESDNLTGVLISDSEYPARVALSIVSKLVKDFSKKFSSDLSKSAASNSFQFKDLEMALAKYQNPSAADAIIRLQNDVDETKEVMYCNLDSLLKRDEKLDDLIAQSEELSLAAKAFYVTAKKTNKCCNIL